MTKPKKKPETMQSAAASLLAEKSWQSPARKQLARRGGRKLTCDCEKPECQVCRQRAAKRRSRARIKRRKMLAELKAMRKEAK